MEKKELLDKTVETLRPFETQNLMSTIQNLTLQEIFTNWGFLLTAAILIFFGIYKRSKTVLLTLFLLIAMIIMAKYTLPPAGAELTLKSLLPFVGTGMGVGCIIVYFIFIKD